MSLGLARDSILDLAEYSRRSTPSGKGIVDEVLDVDLDEKGREGASVITGGDGDDGDDFFLVDGDDNDRTANHLVNGNPNISRSLPISELPNESAAPAAAVLSSPATDLWTRRPTDDELHAGEQNPHASMNDFLTRSNSGRAGRNQGFNYDYSGYVDYYGESAGIYQELGARNATGGVFQDLFCCLLAPWKSTKGLEDGIAVEEVVEESMTARHGEGSGEKRKGPQTGPIVDEGLDERKMEDVATEAVVKKQSEGGISMESEGLNTTRMQAGETNKPSAEDVEVSLCREDVVESASTAIPATDAVGQETDPESAGENNENPESKGMEEDDDDDEFEDASEYLASEDMIEKKSDSGISHETSTPGRDSEREGHDEEKKGEDILDDDDVSATSSVDTDAYGEKLTEKDRLAVLARLKMAQPDPPIQEINGVSSNGAQNSAETSDSGRTMEDEAVAARLTAAEVNGSVNTSVKKRDLSPLLEAHGKTEEKEFKKGILKRTSFVMPQSQTPNDSKKNKGSGDPAARRSLFPEYNSRMSESTSTDTGEGDAAPKKKVSFAPMARVVTVTSRHDMSFAQRSTTWWQKTDFEDFKKTGRIIAKAMLEGGSEIWLNSNNAWGKRQQAQMRPSQSGSDPAREDEYNRALSKYSGGQFQVPGEEPMQDDFGHKWWCKFGHSRRGLEHIASIEEGRQRQTNVTTAIKAILDEQRRQRMSHMRDSRKLANVAMQYTSWARELASAAGAADAEAVRSNFGRNAKTRAHYLRRGVQTGTGSGWNTRRVHPISRGEEEGTASSRLFSSSPSLSAKILDENTSSSMMMNKPEFLRQRSLVNKHINSGPTKASVPPPPPPPETEDFKKGQFDRQNSNDSMDAPSMMEMLHDSPHGQRSLSKEAAGFGTGEDTNMAAVLTGLGGLTTNLMSGQRVGVR